VTFTISKPSEYPYYLVIGVRNQMNHSINHIITDQVIRKP